MDEGPWPVRETRSSLGGLATTALVILGGAVGAVVGGALGVAFLGPATGIAPIGGVGILVGLVVGVLVAPVVGSSIADRAKRRRSQAPPA